MTDKACRGRGYNRLLMERILAECTAHDGIFLYANDSVLDYYPRFGFRPVREFRYRAALRGAAGAAVRPVPMAGPEDWRRFLEEKGRRQSRGLLRLDTDGLLMFYLTQFMAETVFYVPGADAWVIAEQEGPVLTVYDVFDQGETPLPDICRAFGPGVERVEFAFTPASRAGLEEYEHHEEDTTLFVLGRQLEQDLAVFRGFPQLAHT